MTREVMTAELLVMRKRAEQTLQNVYQISRNLHEKRRSLQQMVEDYGAKRVELLKQEFIARGMTWCTYCSEVIPQGETELLLVEGRGKYSCGYENSCYGFRDFSKLHRACLACREHAADQHGQKSGYYSQETDQSIFYAFRVEKREDGHYARKFGHWDKLKEENCKLNEPSWGLVEKLAEEWGLPPRIETSSRGSGYGDKLVIYERAKVAEAS